MATLHPCEFHDVRRIKDGKPAVQYGFRFYVEDGTDGYSTDLDAIPADDMAFLKEAIEVLKNRDIWEEFYEEVAKKGIFIGDTYYNNEQVAEVFGFTDEDMADDDEDEEDEDDDEDEEDEDEDDDEE